MQSFVMLCGQKLYKMVGNDIVTFVEVQTMRRVPEVAAVKVYGIHSFLFCQLMDVFKQQTTTTFTPMIFERAQVININDPAAVKHLHFAIT